MYLVRNVFQAKPGRAKDLVEIFKTVAQHIEDFGVKMTYILTDATGPFWTVVLESQVENLNDYFDMPAKMRDKPEIAEAMKGYMDLVSGGHREIYKIEHSA